MAKMTKSLSLRLRELLKSEFGNSSRNLRRFALKGSYHKDHYRILKHDGELYIGYVSNKGWLSGAKLLRVACGEFNTYAYSGVLNPEDVTEWFIEEYSAKGMCAYDGGWNHDWEEYAEGGEDFRKCKFCGKLEIRMVRMVPEVWWEDA